MAEEVRDAVGVRGYHWDPRDEGFPTNSEINAIPTNPHGMPVQSGKEWNVILPYPEYEIGRRCMSIAEQALGTFIEKNNIYGEPDDEDLGSRGQYADMHRKWKRIKRHMWDGEPWPDAGESFQEVCMDFIGHLLLTMDFKRRGQ